LCRFPYSKETAKKDEFFIRISQTYTSKHQRSGTPCRISDVFELYRELQGEMCLPIILAVDWIREYREVKSKVNQLLKREMQEADPACKN
jgi:hypothetical protein